ncbi:trichothecene biosynthesis acetyltransferase [Apodospora peruviana]|uniref:Trichothecene biosynthesis acetyltransferase n=1 Tax=Apodospora peruviana TaxID=516989 RepID=A0AAE0IGS0_9PEZI|nr:trichothecene biosynthesis acetyltransferase [Apodospora peruviana]
MGSLLAMEEDYNDLDRYQDILGQLPMLQVYAHILYFFPIPEWTDRQQIVSQLEEAITKVREKVPWMGARVVNVGKGPKHSGIYRVAACPKPDRPIEVRDVRDKVASYADFSRKKAPLSMIDPQLLTPVSAFPIRFEDSEQDPARVIRLQASFITGGLILDFVIHHNMVDAGGHFGYVKLMAMAMRGEEFPEALLREANRDRRNLFALLTPTEPMLDHSHHRRPPITAAAPLAAAPEPARYHIFRFTVEKMNKLKAISSNSDEMDPDVPFITTDDALSAFCWKRLTAARARHFPPDTKSRFSRAIDGRGVLGLSPNYMGDVIHNVPAWLTFKELVDWPISKIASHLRKRLNQVNTAYHVRSFATFISKEADKSTITYAGEFNPATDVGCSSIRGRKDLFPDFGALGKPQLIRRPPPAPFPGLVVFFPANEAGDSDAMVCLTETEFAALSRDPEWTEFIEYIG